MDAPILDLLIEGAVVLTADPSAPVLNPGRIGVTGNRITHLGPAEGAAPPAREVIDARGHVAIPGLMNVHTHAILSMVRGVAEDMGFAPAYTPGVPHGHDVTEAEAVAMARLGALEALKFGSTLINDSFVHQELTLPAMADLGIRAWGCGRIHDVDFSRVHLKEWTYSDAIGAWTLDLAESLYETCHGKADGRIGVHLAAHAPDTCSRRQLERVRDLRDRTGLRTATHLCQSRIEVETVRERDGMSPPELLDEVGLLDDRLLSAHCIFVTDSDIERIGRAGMHVAHIPKGNATGATIAPTDRLRAAGARLTLATDNMHADMVEVMRWGLNMGRIQRGAISDDWQPETVFAMATMGGARAMGLEHELGSLTEGKKADIVLLDYRRPHLVPLIDPLGNLVHTAQGRDVRHVVVDGRIVLRDGRSTLANEDEILRDAQRAAEALWSRARAELARMKGERR
ncbi:amidohydrolase family protein [Halovulum dunhuangense]|uniref:Amidohydrolase family protein n=1 Tax=Halovulum dunhuangense TaxID=1505036 RepID=A0A849L7W9_9RHOB|nr:amidohydrolase family protein [Halovulum dunhuangense]NNU82224.1 amidohydrolase family protein [Halovulum dunhuangense]